MISIIIRTTLMFFLVMFTMRVMGKKSLGEFQPSDLVSVMLISNLTSIVIEAPELPILYSVVPILLIMCYEVFMSVAVRKSDMIAKISQGEEKILIKQGVIDQKIMQDLRLTTDDILEAVRNKDIFYLEEVNLAVVETTGTINIYPNPNAKTEVEKASVPPMSIISDGTLKQVHIETVGITQDKIDKILDKENIPMENVLLLMVDGDGRYNLIRKEI